MTYLLVYLFGVVITTGAFIDNLDKDDFIASLICGIFWPFTVSIKAIRALTR